MYQSIKNDVIEKCNTLKIKKYIMFISYTYHIFYANDTALQLNI